MIQNTPAGTGTFTVTVPTTGGFTGTGDAFRMTAQTYVNSISVAHINTAYIFAPSSVSIAGLNYSYDLKFLGAQGRVLSVAYSPLLLQNDTYYAAASDNISGTNWTAFSRPSLIASDFVNVGGLGLVNALGPGPTNPDFSCNGAPIQFGYMTANSTPVPAAVTKSRLGFATSKLMKLVSK